jgi:hypothetical protein
VFEEKVKRGRSSGSVTGLEMVRSVIQSLGIGRKGKVKKKRESGILIYGLLDYGAGRD